MLLFAPGGLRSRPVWRCGRRPPTVRQGPWVDWTEALPAAGFTAVAMDQRNAGQSRTDIQADHGWHTYAADHMALMDNLGFGKFHVLGGCIGGSFCLKAVQTAPAPASRRRCCRTRSGCIPTTPNTFRTAMPNGATSNAPPGRP